MKKIAIINQDSGYLATDIVNEFAKTYDEVVLICGHLHRHERELCKSVKIDKICAYNRESMLKRFYSWIKASFQIFKKLLFHYRNYEIVYFSNPPLACFCSLILNNKFRIIEFDIYPDALKSIGITSHNFVYKIWAYYKRKLYKRADHIYTLSDGMKSIISQYIDECKITPVPLWSASERFHPIDKNKNFFIRQHGLENKFIVMYSGNIGHTHNVECLVKIAKQMWNEKNIIFLIIGEGGKKEELIKISNQEKLDNILFLPFQEIENLPFSLASADLGVITLDETVSKASVPSKTFNLLAVGAPLLAIACNDTEINRLIKKYNCGRTIDKNNINEMVNYILELKNNSTKKNEFQNNAIRASENFTYKNAKLYL